jgi:hypothetical protein
MTLGRDGNGNNPEFLSDVNESIHQLLGTNEEDLTLIGYTAPELNATALVDSMDAWNALMRLNGKRGKITLDGVTRNCRLRVNIGTAVRKVGGKGSNVKVSFKQC